ncbi:MAG: dockerin type I domain-containing protein [Candidatus Omnitrophota bacterium]
MRKHAVITFLFIALFVMGTTVAALAGTGGYTKNSSSGGASGNADIVPTGVCGDADNNGGIDIDDMILVYAYIFAGGEAPSFYLQADATGDDAVDIDDFLRLQNYIFGQGEAPACHKYVSCLDYNGNGRVNTKDLEVLIAYIFQGGDLPAGGDATGDGVIDVDDYAQVLIPYLSGTKLLPPLCGSRAFYPCLDATNDGQSREDDVEAIINAIFNGQPLPPKERADCTGDGIVDIDDVSFAIDFHYNNGPEPVCSSTGFLTPSSVESYCGDGICNGAETCATCSMDCGTCPAPEPTPSASPSTTTSTMLR